MLPLSALNKFYSYFTWVVSLSVRGLQQGDLDLPHLPHEVSQVDAGIVTAGGRVGVLAAGLHRVEDVDHEVSLQALEAELAVGGGRGLLVLGVVLRAVWSPTLILTRARNEPPRRIHN